MIESSRLRASGDFKDQNGVKVFLLLPSERNHLFEGRTIGRASAFGFVYEFFADLPSTL